MLGRGCQGVQVHEIRLAGGEGSGLPFLCVLHLPLLLIAEFILSAAGS